MGVSEQEIFGQTPRDEPATPGSYGLPPAGFRLPAATRLGPVQLQVADLERSLDFYQGTLGLHRLASDGSRALLGSPSRADTEVSPAAPIPGTPLVELHERAGALPAPSRGRTGLFHFAILLPDRPALGRFARHLGEIGARAGTADHLVSQSFYLQDPDNLGIEVYVDRPRSSWRRVGRELMMATDPLDVAGLVEAAGGEPWRGVPAGTVMGHVHLHVGDLAAAGMFYSEGLGLDRTVWDYPGALFLAAGGYHHHLGTNLWAGRDARPAAAGEAQLLEWTLDLPDEKNLTAASHSLARVGSVADRDDAGGAPSVATLDPWGTRVRLRLAPTAGPG